MVKKFGGPIPRLQNSINNRNKMTLLAQGWQNDVVESVAGGGGPPYIYIILMVSKIDYRSLLGFFVGASCQKICQKTWPR